MKKTERLLLFCFLGSCFLLSSQSATRERLNQAIRNNEIKSANTKTIDSLLLIIKNAAADTVKLKTYLSICAVCEMTDNLKYSQPVLETVAKLIPQTKDSLTLKSLVKWHYEAVKYQSYYYFQNDEASTEIEKLFKEHIQLALKYKEYESYTAAVVELGNLYFRQGKMLQKLNCLDEGYRIAKQAGYYRGVSRMLIQMAFFYAENKDTTAALRCIQQAEQNETNIHDDTRKNRGYVIRGNFYRDLGQYDKALDAYQKGIIAYQAAKDEWAISDIYRQMGILYLNKEDFQKALEAHNKGEEIAQTINDLGLMVHFMIGKGDALAGLGKTDEAIEAHKWLWDKVTQKFDEVDHSSLVYFGSHLAKDYVLAQYYQKAKTILDRITPITEVVVERANLEKLSFQTDSALGNYKEALRHQLKFVQLEKKLNDAEIVKVSARQKLKSDLEKQQLEHEKENAIAREEKKKQTIILYSVLGVVGLLILLAAVIFRSLRKTRQANKIIAEQKQEVEHQKAEVEEQKHLVEEKQKEIVDSITYAKRLQQAILPPQHFIDQHIADNFVLYKPKDIVAGDFYWAESIRLKNSPGNNFSGNPAAEERELFFIAAADSTGHGVPGAMVSVVCSNALNRAVKEFDLTETGKILDKTRELVIATFAKSATDVKDGMDVSLLCIDKKNKHLFWSGANNPLWYVHESVLTEIKADKQPIGKSDNQKPFTTHKLPYQENSVFYLFTDGLADQFGGPSGKKFKYKQFEELLVTIHNMPMPEQSRVIEQKFDQWKGSLEQVDDVCVIGLKI